MIECSQCGEWYSDVSSAPHRCKVTIIPNYTPYHPAPTILSCELVDGRIEVVKRLNQLPPHLANGATNMPPKIWKEVYGAREYMLGSCMEGQASVSGIEIVLIKTIPAKYVPAQPESWSLEEEEA